jgi:predicted anti-sigma-YlaC factor YlaD
MTCEEVRNALSARLDGEDPGAGAEWLDSHLARCAACARWLTRAERVTRAIRLRPVEVPDLTAGVLAAVDADPEVNAALRRRAGVTRGRHDILRIAVGAAAVAQLMLALPLLLGGLGMMADPHTNREMASCDVALAVGFALAAYRPERARAFVPVAFVLAICLAGTSAHDIANASTALVHEIGHLAAVVQAALLWALGRTTRALEPTPRRAA